MAKEKCIRCGRETEYNVSTPVTVRRWYIEGSGQLCEMCFYELYPVPGAFDSDGYVRSAGQDQNKKE